MNAEPAAEVTPDPVAERAAQIVTVVFEHFPRTLTEVAEEIGAPALELAPLVAALERHGVLAWDAEHTGLRPGTTALRFARSGAGGEDLVELAQESMRRIAQESGETPNLIIPRPAGTEAIAQIDGRHLLGATNWIGRELGLHCTAAGKVFLAFGVADLPDGELAALTSGDGDRPRAARRRAEDDPRAGLRDDRGRARVRSLGGRGAWARSRGRRGRGA